MAVVTSKWSNMVWFGKRVSAGATSILYSAGMFLEAMHISPNI